MKPVPFDYAAPATLNEALALLARHGEDSRPIAGGQSLAPMLALRLARPAMLVDINRIPALAGITVEDGFLRIGAMTRQAAVLASSDVTHCAPLLREALRHVGHPATRARGTIGGSLAHADPAAELPVAIAALDAEMTIVGADGARRIAAADFFLGAFETAVRPGEILTEIRIPVRAGRVAFAEVSPRKGDFAILSVAVTMDISASGACSSCAIVLGGAADRPIRCDESEKQLRHYAATKAGLDAAIAALPLDAIETDNRMASAAYRKRIAPVLVRRALDAALSGRQETLS